MNATKASAAALVLFLLLGAVVAAAPFRQNAPLTTDQQILLTLDSLQTVDAMLYGTLDSYAISTQVATLVSTSVPTNTARPSSTRTPPPTPTEDILEATPTPEVLLHTFTPTATFFSATNTHTPTRTPDIPVYTNTPEPRVSRGVHIVATAGLNVRHCPSTDCEREPQKLPYDHYTDVWFDTCSSYLYVKGLGYWPVPDGDYVWCQLNVTGTQAYWIAIQYQDQVWAEWWFGVDP